MARQYDVCRVVGLRAESPVDLVVLLQDDTLSDLATRVIAPLVPVGERYKVDRATPVVALDGIRYIIAMHLMATVSRRNLGQVVGSLGEEERAIKAAIDAIFFGV